MRESFSNLLQKPWVIPVGVGLVSASAGFAGGYFYGKKMGAEELLRDVEDSLEYVKYETKEEPDALQDEVSELPEVEDWDVDETPVEPILVDGKSFTTYNDVIKEQGYSDEDEGTTMEDTDLVVEEEAPAPVRTHIFEPPDDIPEWDYDREIATREENPDAPYVIHSDEFVRNDMGYVQETVTYYALDDVVADASDNAVYNPERILGPFKDHFGYGSNDKSVVYVRNTALRREWEILLHSGGFTTEVLGLEIEENYEESDIRHSSDRRFRDRD